MKDALDKMFDVVVAFNKEKEYLGLLDLTLLKMMEITNADAGTLYIVENGKLYFRIVKNNSLNIFQSGDEVSGLPPVELNKASITNVCAYSAIHNEFVSIDDVYVSDRFNFEGPRNYDKMTGYRSQSMLTMPMTATMKEDSDVIGVIQLLNAKDWETGEVVPFEDVHNPPVIPALLNISSNTLANLAYEREIKEMFHSFVEVMTSAIDERSPYNSRHTQNVADYCRRFAAYLSLRFEKGHYYHFDENRTEQLVLAAMLHDIGKIITPLEIMDKADRLGMQLEPLKLRFEIKRCQLKNEALSGRLSGGEYELRLKELEDALALVLRVNTMGYLPDDVLARVEQLSAIMYESGGNMVSLFTEQNMQCLRIRKGTLNDEERAIIQGHVFLTQRLLDKMNFKKQYKDVPRWASSHHEFLDGTGYGHMMSDEGGSTTISPPISTVISIETQILTIMDIYEALTAADRPYKKSIPPQESLFILSEMANEGKLNAELVNLFRESGTWSRENA